MRDYRFHCEDCDSYSQCQYYHNRKGTSLICKEFQYGSSVIEQIRAEIEQLTSRYSISKERGGMGQVEWSDRLIKESDVLQIIDKYKGDKE